MLHLTTRSFYGMVGTTFVGCMAALLMTTHMMVCSMPTHSRHKLTPRPVTGAAMIVLNRASTASFAESRTRWFGMSPQKGSCSPLKVSKSLHQCKQIKWCGCGCGCPCSEGVISKCLAQLTTALRTRGRRKWLCACACWMHVPNNEPVGPCIVPVLCALFVCAHLIKLACRCMLRWNELQPLLHRCFTSLRAFI